jgi:hypothetical protein
VLPLKNKTRKEIQDLIERGGMITHPATGAKYLVTFVDKSIVNGDGDYAITCWDINEGQKVNTYSDTIYSRRKKYAYTGE